MNDDYDGDDAIASAKDRVCDSSNNNEDNNANDNNANDVEAPLRSSSDSSLVANGSSTARENHNPSPDGSPCPNSPISKLLHEGHDKVMRILHNNQSDSSASQQDPFQMRFRDLLCIADVVADVNKQRLNDKHNQLCDRPQKLSPEDKKRLRDILMAGLKVADKLIDLVSPSNRQLDIFLFQPAEENEPGGYNEGLLKTLSMNVFFDRISVQAATSVQLPLEMLPHVLTARIVVSILTFDSVRMKGPLAGFLCGFARQQRHSQQQPIPFIIDAMPGAAWLASRNSFGTNIKEAQWVEDLKLLLPSDEPWPAVVVMKNSDKQEHQQEVVKNVKRVLRAGRGRRNYGLSWPTWPTFWLFRRQWDDNETVCHDVDETDEKERVESVWDRIRKMLQEGHKEAVEMKQRTQCTFDERCNDLLRIAQLLADINKQRLSQKYDRMCDRPLDLAFEETRRLREIVGVGLSVAEELIDLVPSTERQFDIFLSKPGGEDAPGGYNEGMLKKLGDFKVFYDRMTMLASTTGDPQRELFCHVLTSHIVLSILTFDSVCKKWTLAELLCGLARIKGYAGNRIPKQPIPLVIDAMPGSAWMSSCASERRNIPNKEWFEYLKILLPMDMLWPIVVVMKKSFVQDHQSVVVESVKNALGGSIATTQE